MSHYAIAVFADRPMDFDRLLAPYSENNEKEFVFEPVPDEEILAGWKKFRKQNPSWKYSNWLNKTYTLRDGRYGHWYNPHGYYDYYSLGSRDYMYDLLPDVEARYRAEEDWPEYFKKSELDWFAVEEDRGEAYYKKRWREYMKDGDGFYSAKYYEERYGTCEQFVKEMMRPSTPYAFVTPDGVWHAPGRVGWFATSDETAETMDAYWDEWYKFITEAPDCYVSLVDCHI